MCVCVCVCSKPVFLLKKFTPKCYRRGNRHKIKSSKVHDFIQTSVEHV